MLWGCNSQRHGHRSATQGAKRAYGSGCCNFSSCVCVQQRLISRVARDFLSCNGSQVDARANLNILGHCIPVDVSSPQATSQKANSQRVNWVCKSCPLSLLHRWIEKLAHRTNLSTGCQCCSGHAVCKCNSL